MDNHVYRLNLDHNASYVAWKWLYIFDPLWYRKSTAGCWQTVPILNFLSHFLRRQYHGAASKHLWNNKKLKSACVLLYAFKFLWKNLNAATAYYPEVNSVWRRGREVQDDARRVRTSPQVHVHSLRLALLPHLKN